MIRYIIIIFFCALFWKQNNAQNIYTFAGTGNFGYSGDGGSALLADITAATGIVTDKKGNVYFCEWYYGLIRKVDISTGIITTIAGGLVADLSDNILAVNALVRHPWGLTVDSIGNLYFAEQQFNQVRKIDTNGIITTIAGLPYQIYQGQGSFSGDGALATAALLNGPSDVAVDMAGNVYIADGNNHRIRMVNTSGIITTIAGSSIGALGDGGLAINSKLYYPLGLAIDKNNNLYIGDAGNHRIRKIDASGIINTIVGTGVQGNTGDGGLAVLAKMGSTRGLQVDNSGNLFFADRDYGVVRKVDNSGVISTIVGTGINGYSGDGGLATLAQIDPIDCTFDKAGNLFITDNLRVRIVCSNLPLTLVSTSSVTCASESVTLSVNGASSYTWSTGSTNPSIIVTPTMTTTYTVNGAGMVGCSYSGSITQNVNACVGIEEYNIDQIDIYPNPTNNILQIIDVQNSFENAQVEIMNTIGQVILKQVYEDAIDVSKLPTGIYLLRINTSGKQDFYTKFIKA